MALRGTNCETAVSVAEALGSSWDSDDDLYQESPFLPLKKLSPRTKGSHMEAIVERHLRNQGYQVAKATNSQHDRRADGLQLEIKGSFLWNTSPAEFRWQQIRVDQQYDYLVCAAFYPDRVEYYGCTHEVAFAELTKRDEQGRLPHNQHGGKTADSGTYYIQGLPGDYPWLQPLHVVLPAPRRRTPAK